MNSPQPTGRVFNIGPYIFWLAMAGLVFMAVGKVTASNLLFILGLQLVGFLFGGLAALVLFVFLTGSITWTREVDGVKVVKHYGLGKKGDAE